MEQNYVKEEGFIFRNHVSPEKFNKELVSFTDGSGLAFRDIKTGKMGIVFDEIAESKKAVLIHRRDRKNWEIYDYSSDRIYNNDVRRYEKGEELYQ